MGIRVKRLKQHNKWTSTINESKDKYALSVIKIANSLVRQGKTLETSKELEELFLQSEEQILDLIFESLEQTYALSCSMVKEVYNITSKSIDLKDLTYDGDDKTLEERLLQYFQELIAYILECIKNDEPIDWDKIKRNLHHRLLLVLDTETQTVKIKVTRRKIEGHCEFGEVLPGECCPGSGGIYPIDELDIPPFHPNCMCEVIYYEELTDDMEEIEDLELEVERIYE